MTSLTARLLARVVELERELDCALAGASIHADEHRKSRERIAELEKELEKHAWRQVGAQVDQTLEAKLTLLEADRLALREALEKANEALEYYSDCCNCDAPGRTCLANHTEAREARAEIERILNAE